MKRIAAVLLFLSMTTVFAQQVYKWTDKNGNVHYSQMPPASTVQHAKSIDVTPQAADPAGVKEAQDLENQMQARDKQAADQQKQADADARKQAQLKQRCDALKSELQVLLQAGPVAMVGPDGKSTYLSDKEHVQKEQQLQDEINRQCGS